jgi:hypothetical protein
MAVHRISLLGAILLVLLAFLLWSLVGLLGLLLLVVAVILMWYAFGPGSRGAVVVTAP